MFLKKLGFVLLIALAIVKGGCEQSWGQVQHGGTWDFSGQVQEASKALVHITAIGKGEERHISNAELLKHYYGGGSSLNKLQVKSSIPSGSRGSGFLIDLEQGLIVTNEHVVDKAEFDKLELKLANGKTYDGEIVGRDAATDVAVVAIKDEHFDRSGLGQLRFGDSDKLQRGEPVFALGAPLGYDMSVTAGIVAALRRTPLSAVGEHIQIDVEILSGNSGGPLLNMEGEVVGINAWMHAVKGSEVGFAISANTAQRVVTTLRADGSCDWGSIGVTWRDVYAAERAYLQLDTYPELDDSGGVLVSSVAKGSPAEKGGLRFGDVVFAIGGVSVEDKLAAVNAIAFSKPDSRVALQVIRKGKLSKLKVKVAPRQTDEQMSPVGATQKISKWGIEVAEIRKNSTFYERTLRSGLLLLSAPRFSGLSRGDFIVMMDDVEVESLQQFEQYLAEREKVLLYIERHAGQYDHVLLEKKDKQ